MKPKQTKNQTPSCPRSLEMEDTQPTQPVELELTQAQGGDSELELTQAQGEDDHVLELTQAQGGDDDGIELTQAMGGEATQATQEVELELTQVTF